jgi:hypothetical protein
MPINIKNKYPVYIIILYLLYNYSILYAQLYPVTLWSKTYSCCEFDDIVKTSSGNITVLGTKKITDISDGKQYHLWVMGIDDTGKKQWEKTYGDNVTTLAADIHSLEIDNGYIIVGNKLRDIYESFWILRLKQNGDSLWSVSFRDRDSLCEYIKTIVPTADGGFFASGSSNFRGKKKVDAFFIKLNSNGDTLWTRYYGGKYDDGGNKTVVLKDGGFMVAGRTRDSSAIGIKDDLWILRLNSVGDTLWTKKIGEKNFESIPYDMKQTKDNGFIITGLLGNLDSSDIRRGAEQRDSLFILKINSNGEKEWKIKYDKVIRSEGYSVDNTPDSGYIVCGTIDSGNPVVGSKSRLFLMRLDTKGTILWTQTYGDGFFNWGEAVVQTDGNKFIAAGSANDTAWILEIEERKNSGSINNSKKQILENARVRFVQNTGYCYDVLGRKRILNNVVNISANLLSGSIIIMKNDKTRSFQKVIISR